MITIDTHAHLDEIEDLDSAITRAREAGVKSILCVGSSYTSNLRVLEISQQYHAYVFPALGLHPWEIHNANVEMLNRTLEQIETNVNSIFAIGEIGLDYDKRVIKLTSKDKQKIVLRSLLDMAVKYDKPVSLHSRYAWKDCLDIVKQAGVKKAIFHWFTGFSSVLKDLLQHGYYISCTPAAEYHEEHRRAIKEAPLEQLLLETDAPVYYGRELKYRSEPADVVRSLKAIATIKDININDVAYQTTSNATRVLKFI